MPVTIPLIDLVCVPGAKRVWPSEFQAFIETIESEPDDRTNYLVLADWLRDQGEFSLEKACRYFVKNELLTMRKSRYDGWEITNPLWLQNVEHGIGFSSDTPAGPLADLGLRLQKLAEELA